jgi:hypothetical protein
MFNSERPSTGMEVEQILVPRRPPARRPRRRPKPLTETRLRADIDVDQIDIDRLRQLVRRTEDKPGDWERRYDIEDDKVKRSDTYADKNYRDFLEHLIYEGEARIQRFDREIDEREYQRALTERYGHIDG